MFSLFYSVLTAALTPVVVPFWILRSLFKGHPWSDVRESLGWLPREWALGHRHTIWFHAVSVGEVQSSLQFLERLRRNVPGAETYVSVSTGPGLKLARDRLAGSASGVFRAPVDLAWVVARVYRKLRPRLVVVAETELWPGYFFQAARNRVPVVVVNGRISDRAAPRYRWLRTFFRPVLAKARLILVQSDGDRTRFLDAGAIPDSVRVGGNFKYDSFGAATRPQLPTDLGSFLRRARPQTMLVAGSTRDGEEQMLLPALRGLARREPRTLAVVAPRHPERFGEAWRVIKQTELTAYRRSRLPAEAAALPAVLLLDSIGELAALYEHADLAFVGGSLNGWGGHNVLEPLSFRKPVVVGPHMQNFRQIARELISAGGLVQVQSAEALATALVDLTEDLAKARQVGLRGRAVADAKRGASALAASEAARAFWESLPMYSPTALAKACLWLPAAAWSGVASVRMRLFRRGALRSSRLRCPVISIGNLSVGGTGKTPMVEWLTAQLAKRGYRAAVLTRGYGRDRPKDLRILGAGSGASPDDCGDEPVMMARRFHRKAPKALIAVAAARAAAGRVLDRSGLVDCFVMDDGFQHLWLQRSLDIVLVDAMRPFGNGHCLPLGILREPVSALKHADIIMLTRAGAGDTLASLREFIRGVNPTAPIFRSRTVVTGLVPIGSDGRDAPSELGQVPVATFCGLGNPTAFQAQVRRAGFTVVADFTFPDHHRYSRRDVEDLVRRASEAEAEGLLTSVKDAVNLAAAPELALPAYALQTEIEVHRGERLMEQVCERLWPESSG